MRGCAARRRTGQHLPAGQRPGGAHVPGGAGCRAGARGPARSGQHALCVQRAALGHDRADGLPDHVVRALPADRHLGRVQHRRSLGRGTALYRLRWRHRGRRVRSPRLSVDRRAGWHGRAARRRASLGAGPVRGARAPLRGDGRTRPDRLHWPRRRTTGPLCRRDAGRPRRTRAPQGARAWAR